MDYKQHKKDYLTRVKEYAKSKGFRKGDVRIEYHDGRLGLEDMGFPTWDVTISYHQKHFSDQIRYARRFGQTWFLNSDSNFEPVKAWIDEIAGNK